MYRKPPFLHLQRVLAGQTPDQVLAERLTAKPALAKAKPSGRAGPCDITKARLIAQSAKEVSQPDNYHCCVKNYMKSNVINGLEETSVRGAKPRAARHFRLGMRPRSTIRWLCDPAPRPR